MLDEKCRGSRHRFARDTGISRSFVDRILKFESVPSIETLARIADAYEIDVRELLAPTSDTPDH